MGGGSEAAGDTRRGKRYPRSLDTEGDERDVDIRRGMRYPGSLLLVIGSELRQRDEGARTDVGLAWWCLPSHSVLGSR